MSDEEKKRIVSQPPPPTDEVDGEWGDDDQTLVRELPESVIKSQPAPPGAAVAGTAVAPISVPAKAAEASTPSEMKAAPLHAASEEDDDEDEGEDEDEDEESSDDEDESDHGHAPDQRDHFAHGRHTTTAASKDWIPEWAPFAVLALLVSVSILVGLGLVGGSSDSTEESAGEPAAEAQKPVTKPSAHP